MVNEDSFNVVNIVPSETTYVSIQNFWKIEIVSLINSILFLLSGVFLSVITNSGSQNYHLFISIGIIFLVSGCFLYFKFIYKQLKKWDEQKIPFEGVSK